MELDESALSERQALTWDVIVELESLLKRRVDRAVRHCFGVAATQDRRDEAWSHVVSQADRIARLWDPTKSTIEQRVVYCFYWYARNWARDTLRQLRKEYAHGTSGAYSESSSSLAVENAESRDGVSRAIAGETAEEHEAFERVVENLSEYQRWLVKAHYMEDRTLRDIGEQVGVSRTTIAKDLEPINKLLREALRGYR